MQERPHLTNYATTLQAPHTSRNSPYECFLKASRKLLKNPIQICNIEVFGRRFFSLPSGKSRFSCPIHFTKVGFTSSKLEQYPRVN